MSVINLEQLLLHNPSMNSGHISAPVVTLEIEFSCGRIVLRIHVGSFIIAFGDWPMLCYSTQSP